MKGYKSLRQVCEMLCLSRRAIQGYEKTGLIKPTAKNKYGHLLYDEKTINRIAGIQYCQKLGIELKTVFALTNEERHSICNSLEKHLSKLKNKKEELDYMISKTDKIIKNIQDSDTDFLEVIYETIKEDI